jgi:D-serine deaminase-like pyridoxal phosphate-dependent protein
MSNWYPLNDPTALDSPALLVYPERAAANIDRMIAVAGDIGRLRPHVKTHKAAPIVAMHLARGITKFKCSTIAEADMLAQAGAREILLAYQPVGPKLGRLVRLAADYPEIDFGSLVDHEAMLQSISAAAQAAKVTLRIWVDLNNGMNRTGITPGAQAQSLYEHIAGLPGVEAGGLHAYDGHVRQSAFDVRKGGADSDFEVVQSLRDRLEANGHPVPTLIAGGTPTFPVHALRAGTELSPGTYVYSDAGYGTTFPDLPFEPAALVMTRVISKPGGSLVTVDLGHKAIASENPIDKRVRFLNAEVTRFVSQSEEHLVLEVPNWDTVTVGDVWYGIPWHICPTVALYQEAQTVVRGELDELWELAARGRKIRY